MESGLDYTLKGTTGNCVRFTFHSVGWEGLEDLLYLRGVVDAQGYTGHFEGYSNIEYLRDFITGLKEGRLLQPPPSYLPIFDNEVGAISVRQPVGADCISIVFRDQFVGVVSGKISAPLDDELTYVQMEFGFRIDIEALNETLCDLETIFNILNERYESARIKR